MNKKIPLCIALGLMLTTASTMNGEAAESKINSTYSVATTVKNPFKDVSPKSANYYIIHEMRDMGIINGYSDGTFKPSNEISRQNAVAMITRYTPVKYEGTKKVPTLTDVTTKNANYKGLVEFQKLGVFNVSSNGKIYPTKAMTRGEMAKALVIAFDLPIDSKATTKLKDVPSSLKPYVSALEKAKITTGYDDNTFRPNTTLSRSHFAAFMHRAIKHKEEQGVVVGKPVPTEPTKPVIDLKPTNNEVLVNYSPKLEDVILVNPPLPDLKGMARNDFARHQNDIFSAYIEEKGFTQIAYGSIEKFMGNNLGYLAGKFQISSEELFRVLNYTQQTGEVYKGEHFTLYFKNTKRDDGIMYFNYAFMADEVQ